ncbi:MAG: GGDEF domain-containing protein, partial [Campylobacterales bacterium]|nr:GGDEF domain-containing protein [Campylobacterales bacterium]
MFQWLKDFFVDNSRNTFKEEKDNDFEGYGYMKRVYGIDNMPRFETIAKLTRTDPLTKAYNRIAFEDSLQHEIYISQRYKTDFSIVLIKIKDFTTINNEYGTLVGDQVLKETFIKIKESLRASDTIFRWGGVEFL